MQNRVYGLDNKSWWIFANDKAESKLVADYCHANGATRIWESLSIAGRYSVKVWTRTNMERSLLLEKVLRLLQDASAQQGGEQA